MSGARILLAVLLAGAVLLWLALAGGAGEDLERGLEQTDAALAAVEAELAALDPAFQALRAQGLLLGLREEHDRIRSLLARHKDRRVAIRTDPTLDPRRRLPQLRDLVDEIDATLALAKVLHRTVDALTAFRRDVLPVLEESRGLHGRLAGLEPSPGAGWGARRATLAASMADLEQRMELAHRLLRENVGQGTALAERTLAELRSLLDQQRALLREAGAPP